MKKKASPKPRNMLAFIVQTDKRFAPKIVETKKVYNRKKARPPKAGPFDFQSIFVSEGIASLA